jgi:hypothetical protein
MWELQGDYVNAGDVCRDIIGQQSQYCRGYATGSRNYPNLGKGLRVHGDPGDYHSIMIHKDDYKTFVKRMAEYKKTKGGW